MNEAKFTPGPWYVSREARGCATVCTVTRVLGIKTDKIPENDPVHDANLIAAAPEMYEMLEDAADMLFQSGEAEFRSHGMEIRKLLAKARGESC